MRTLEVDAVDGSVQPATPFTPATPVTSPPRSKVVHHMGGDDRSSTRVRMVDAALRCLARQGATKTTVDDIARESGFSRATLYRTFPGGKEDVLEAVVSTEVARLFSSLAVAMGGASDLEEVLVAGMTEAARHMSTHRALGYMLSHEPGAILPSLTFAGMDRILFMAGDLAAPFFARWLDPDQASRAAEWAIRIVLTYVADPAPGADLTDPDDTRALVRTFVLPGILALREPSGEFTSVSPVSSTEPHPSSEPTLSTTSKGAVQ